MAICRSNIGANVLHKYLHDKFGILRNELQRIAAQVFDDYRKFGFGLGGSDGKRNGKSTELPAASTAWMVNGMVVLACGNPADQLKMPVFVSIELAIGPDTIDR